MNKIKEWLKYLIEDFMAFRRGERRIAPRGATGRVYEKKEGKAETSPGGHAQVTSRATGKLSMKVTRADGTVEYYEAPAEGIKYGD